MRVKNNKIILSIRSKNMYATVEIIEKFHHLDHLDHEESKLGYKFNNRVFLLQVISIYQKRVNLNYIIHVNLII